MPLMLILVELLMHRMVAALEHGKLKMAIYLMKIIIPFCLLMELLRFRLRQVIMLDCKHGAVPINVL
jgi:hypothetical protein